MRATTLLGAFALAACSGDTGGPESLTIEELRQATYRDVLAQPVVLTDGRFEGEPFTRGSASRPVVTLVPDVIARGELTGDEVDEAVVVLAHNSGGSGVFLHLAVVKREHGKPDNIATTSLGDRVKVVAVGADDGIVFADLVVHGPDDPMCCPSQDVRREWRLDGGKLVALETSPGTQGDRYSGHLVWGHENRSFSLCDESREAWVINESGDELIAVYEELTHAPYQPMFVELRGEWVAAPTEGFGADFDDALRVTELIRAENEGFGCRLDLRDVLFAATGNEPSWRLQIREDGIALRTPELPANLEFPTPKADSRPPLIVFESEDAGAVIKVSLQRRRCVDTMSGARYAWAATVELDGQRLQGCAAEGI